MTELIGIRTMLSKALPTGTDGARLIEWQLRANRTYTEWITEIVQALNLFNTSLNARWGDFVFFTEELQMEYPNGGAITEMEELPDTDRPIPRHNTTISHMIDLRAYGGAVGGTKRYFRDGREATFNADVAGIVSRGRKRYDRNLLRRMFQDDEHLLGTSGYDVGWVNGGGGGGGNVVYTPPAYDGEEFLNTHDHYVGFNSASLGFDDLLEGLAETVQEHGHEPPFIAMVARADGPSYRVLPDFIEPMGNTPIVMVDQANLSNVPRFFSRDNREGGRIGGYESSYGYIELRATSYLTTGYAGLFKSYGNNNERNPIAVRVHPSVGFGAYVVPETTNDDDYPLKQLDVEFEFGISCGRDRTAGAAGLLVQGGAWVDLSLT